MAQSLRERFAGKQGGVAATMTTNTVDLQKQLDDQVSITLPGTVDVVCVCV